MTHTPVKILSAQHISDIKKALAHGLEEYRALFPQDKEACILLKPNLNSHMNSLTGNTTDLRLLASTIEFFQNQGYTNLVIAEGTNSGFYRNKIDVIKRLRIDKLASHYGIATIDLNNSPSKEISLDRTTKVRVAKVIFEAALFINMPKIKTHFEVTMSVCLKNMIGCLVGQDNKKKMHQNLARNVVLLNQQVKPHLHIVDGLIAMEGTGPTRGTPLNLGLILIGTDPFLLDLLCARLAGFDEKTMPILKLALDENIINSNSYDQLKTLPLSDLSCNFAPPRPSFFARVVHNPRWQRYLLGIRHTPLLEKLCSTNFVGKLFFLLGIRQDLFLEEEMELRRIFWEESRCQKCYKCSGYCPLGLDLPQLFNTTKLYCLGCLYCLSVCPTKALIFEGRLGFFQEQIRQYDNLIKSIT
jgi:uncharacterized protein (DUF362 family)/Pyruvate/2-oxoacid:ferredoxin oxidoreductase delta subunit